MDLTPVTAPVHGIVVNIDVGAGQSVPEGAPLLVLESMKMEYVVVAPVGGVVREIVPAPGDVVGEDDVLISIEERTVAADAPAAAGPGERPDLAEVLRRHEVGLDAARPDAVRRRRGTGHRTARENVADLCETFTEYGALAVAAQRARRSLDELIEKTPADGLVAGIGDVNGRPAVVLAYDYTVLAGTQGAMNHYKKDRMLELADRRRLPVVLFAEGGGGRPGDTDTTAISGLDCMAFHLFARLSGQVPLIGIVTGRCFAGNAALLGCCDVVIATEDANIGMGGPAMIEGGGLGVFAPEEVGPMDVQVPNGVVDVLVADEAEAVRVAKRYLSYFQGAATGEWRHADQAALRGLVPQDRKRIYDVRAVIEAVADTGSVLDLRPEYGRGVVTALARVEGMPVGVIANSPAHLGGAIDADDADKMSRFMKLCDAFGLPLVSLCDTPGFMVGPESERTATVRHFGRMFVTGANLSVPLVMIILRKAYGLGAQAMAGGSLKVPAATVAWPTGELGGMGLEGAVRLGYRRELAAAEDPDALFEELVARSYERGKALSAATVYEIDDVIDPADTRRWIRTALRDAPRGERRIPLDTW